MGNGAQIRIWEDKWLPNRAPHAVQSTIQILDRQARVKELIDEDTRWWNVPLIMEIFSAEEAEKICSMPINPTGMVDKLIWSGTLNENFSVKSTYHLEKNMHLQELGECSRAFKFSKFWTELWALHVPGVVKAFSRRLTITCYQPKKTSFFKKK